MGKMDYREFEKLTKNFEGLVKDYDRFLSAFLTREGMKCLADTKRRTPVDTSRLRNSWKLSGPYKSGAGKYVVIHNNVQYASWVEDGHRIVNQFGTYGWQPGVHMGRIALTRAALNLPDNFEKAFVAWCNGKGIGK